jgi:hypothetical protein
MVNLQPSLTEETHGKLDIDGLDEYPTCIDLIGVIQITVKLSGITCRSKSGLTCLRGDQVI